jgi:uncharacterized LabA/DUF88 family protein
MHFQENNFAFVDSQNLNLGVRGLGWRLDFQKFRRYLAEKHSVTKAYLFLGYLPENKKLYEKLRTANYELIFKPIMKLKDGTIKGNIDGELILQAMIDYLNYDRAVIVSGDGDFHCLIQYLRETNKLKAIFIPNREQFSWLLKAKKFLPYLQYMNESKNELRLKKEA